MNRYLKMLPDFYESLDEPLDPDTKSMMEEFCDWLSKIDELIAEAQEDKTDGGYEDG